MGKWPLAFIGNIHNLLHAHHLLNLLGDLGAQARNIHLLDHTTAAI